MILCPSQFPEINQTLFGAATVVINIYNKVDAYPVTGNNPEAKYFKIMEPTIGELLIDYNDDRIISVYALPI